MVHTKATNCKPNLATLIRALQKLPPQLQQQLLLVPNITVLTGRIGLNVHVLAEVDIKNDSEHASILIRKLKVGSVILSPVLPLHRLPRLPLRQPGQPVLPFPNTIALFHIMIAY